MNASDRHLGHGSADHPGLGYGLHWARSLRRIPVRTYTPDHSESACDWDVAVPSARNDQSSTSPRSLLDARCGMPIDPVSVLLESTLGLGLNELRQRLGRWLAERGRRARLAQDLWRCPRIILGW